MRRTLLVSVVLGLACGAAYGFDNFTWTNPATGGGNYWNNAANWGDGTIGIPNTANDNITINNGGRMSIPTAGTYVCGEINLINGRMGGWVSNATIIVTDNEGLSGSVLVTSPVGINSYQSAMTFEVHGDWIMGASTWESQVALLELHGDNHLVRKTATDGPVQNTDIYGSYYEQGSSTDIRTHRFGDLTVKDGGSITGGLWVVRSLKVEGSGTLAAGELIFACRGDQDNTTEAGGKLVLPGGITLPGHAYLGQLYTGQVANSMFVYKMDGGGDLQTDGNFSIYGARGTIFRGNNTLIFDLQDNGTGTPRGATIGGNLQVGSGPTHSGINANHKGLLKAYEGTIRVGGQVACGGSNSYARDNPTYTQPVGSMQLGDVTMYVGGDWLMCRSPSRLTSEFIYANWDAGTSTVIFDGNGTGATQTLYCDELPLHNVIVDNPGGIVQMYSYQTSRDNMIITGDLEIRNGLFRMVNTSSPDSRFQTLRITFNGPEHNWSDNASTTFQDIELVADAVVLLGSDINMGNLFMGTDSKLYLDGFTLTDLVSYEQKHNESNGEANTDGSDANWSRGWGATGRGRGPWRRARGRAALRPPEEWRRGGPTRRPRRRRRPAGGRGGRRGAARAAARGRPGRGRRRGGHTGRPRRERRPEP